MSKVNVKSINTLTIYVTDLDKSKAFYTEQLGFEAGEEMSPGILLQSGDVTLYIEAGRKKRTSELKEYSEFSPCFETDSVKQTYEVLKFSGVKVVEEYQEFAPTFALFKIADPDGNLIEFAGTP